MSTASPAKSNTTKNAPRGQSFIEAMIAITVIVTSIASALALVQSSITASRIGGAQIVAANLAREGIEVVRAARDGNWLRSQSFRVNLTDPGGNKTARPLLDQQNGRWTVSFAPTSVDSANASVYLTSAGAFVQADSPPADGTITPYARVLTLLHICRDNGSGVERIVGGTGTCLAGETQVGLAVTSSVRWRGVAGNFQTLAIEERLYDWR